MKASTVIIGGGITGLACALRLQDLAKEKNLSLDLSLFESGNRLGGVIETVRRDGFIFECGPDSIFTEEPWVMTYLEKLGLASEIVRTNPDRRQSFIYIGTEFVPMSEGLKLIALSEILPFLWSARPPKDFKGVNYRHFISFKDGMQSLARRMAERAPSGSIQLNSGVRRIERARGKFGIFGDGFESEADAVCLALPVRVASSLLSGTQSGLADKLSQIPVRKCATVNLVYESKAVNRMPRGFGFVVSGMEKRKISGATFASVKFHGRAPSGNEIIRVFLNEKSFPGLAQAGDEKILMAAREEIEELLSIEGRPLEDHVKVYLESLPDYREKHEGRIRGIESEISRIEGLALAGNWFNGAGITRCIQSGERAAEKMFSYLTGRKIPKQDV